MTAIPETLLADWERDELTGDPLDFPYIDGVAEDVAWGLLEMGGSEAAFQPGNGTRYNLAFVPLTRLWRARARIVDGSAWPRAAFPGCGANDPDGEYIYDPAYVLVVLGEKAAYPFRLRGGGYLSADYVGGHLGVGGADAVVVTLLLRAIIARLAAAVPTN